MATANTKAASNEALSDQVETLRKDLAGITRTLADLTKTEVSNVRAMAKDKVVTMGERGQEKLDEAGVLARSVEKQAVTYVREKPVQSLAIAAAVGLVAGYLTRSK